MNKVQVLVFRGQQPNKDQCESIGHKEPIYINWDRKDIVGMQDSGDITLDTRVIEVRAPIQRLILMPGDEVKYP